MNLGCCCAKTKVSKIKVEEGCRSAVILNPNNATFNRVKVDQCLPIDGPRADYVVEKGRAAVAIELKGKGVEYAATQIDATCTLWRQLERVDQLCGLIVGVMSPKARPTILVRKSRFAQKFGGPLHVVRANSEYQFQNLFSFKGPFKS